MHAVTFATEPAARGVCVAHRARYWPIVAWCLVGYLLVLGAWSAPSPPDAPEPSPQSEQAIKAAFLFKFLSYVEWPAGVLHGASAPIVVGVLGDDAIADRLRATVARRRIGQHPVVVRDVTESDALNGVHLLFIGDAETAALPRLAPEAQRRSVLLVTDFDHALEAGTVINLVVIDDRVRFEVSLEAAERSNLKLSSRMLAVAMWVRPPR
jgi:hypothetical protein